LSKSKVRIVILLSVVFTIVTTSFLVLSGFAYIEGKDAEPAPGGALYYAPGPMQARPLSAELEQLVPKTEVLHYPDNMLDWLKPAWAVNQDVVGYIRVPGTSIDSVVTQRKNNDHYLRYDFYNKYTFFGTPFLDYRCNPVNLSKNTVIYAHHTVTQMQAFTDLIKYRDPQFFCENPIIEYSTIYETSRWKIFAVFTTPAKASQDNSYVFNYIYPHIPLEKMSGYFQQINERKLYETGVECNAEDQILTLSTCTYDFGRDIDTRLAVVARPLRAGESEEVNASLVKLRPDYRRPQAWYAKQGKENPYKNSEKWYPK